MTPVRWALLMGLAVFMTGAGAYHFVNPIVAWARLPFQGLFIWWATLFVRN